MATAMRKTRATKQVRRSASLVNPATEGATASRRLRQFGEFLDERDDLVVGPAVFFVDLLDAATRDPPILFGQLLRGEYDDRNSSDRAPTTMQLILPKRSRAAVNTSPGTRRHWATQRNDCAKAGLNSITPFD